MSGHSNETARLLTADEVAERLRLKTATVYQAATDGRIPCVRLWKGNRRALIRFHEDDIERLIRERTSTGLEQVLEDDRSK